MVAIRETRDTEEADAFRQFARCKRAMKKRARTFLGVGQFLPPAAGGAYKKFNRREFVHGSLVPSLDRGGNESAALATPTPESPVRSRSVGWQVSRLADDCG